MKNISYILISSLIVLQFLACNNKTKQGVSGQDIVTDPLTLYGEIDRSSEPNSLSEVEKSKGWQILFDGKTSNGWHGYNQQGVPDCWAVEDNCLTMKSVGGNEEQDLITDKEYKKFALSVEYKLTKGANSGVLFQVKEDPKYTFAYETGPEFQVIDHQDWPDPLEDSQINGANYAMYAPMEKPYKPLGEWNQLMLVVDGNDVTQILNGVVVVKYTKYSDEWTALRNSGKWSDFPDYGKYDEGHISLQNHGTKVWYRNIMIKEL
ncbi:DUF1080 domain-containing protein [Dysgonomonas sp. ZJ279]|uniref:3-keto-disaccharide hydrolase n=1 Tax=Dysgonomonas sp. ZJ279 TaxID=2709796 RepID=UPI0013EB5DAA|nr:DUF1080 domain-containing protein [Dysgonomonas sp. ZJ279]